MHQQRILVVLTNTTTLPGQGIETESNKRTGFDIMSMAYLWKEFHTRKHMCIDIATPEGGRAEPCPQVMDCCKNDETLQEFLREKKNMDQFSQTKSIKEFTGKSRMEYDLIVFVGGHGALVDFPKNKELLCFLERTVYEEQGEAKKTQGPIIATTGHGLSALLYLKPTSTETLTSTYFLKGRTVTCFTKEEEQKIGFEKFIPFVLEDKVRDLGAKVEKTSPLQPKVVVDEMDQTWTGRRPNVTALITAQNPVSAKDWVKEIAEYIEKIQK